MSIGKEKDSGGCPNSAFLFLVCLFRSYNSFTKRTEGVLLPEDMFFSAHVIFKVMLSKKYVLCFSDTPGAARSRSEVCSTYLARAEQPFISGDNFLCAGHYYHRIPVINVARIVI